MVLALYSDGGLLDGFGRVSRADGSTIREADRW